jgi:glycosyltransferase involved in cell wall biosynthesis
LRVLFPFVGDSVGGSHHSIVELHRELCNNNISSSIVIHQKGPLSCFLDDIGILYEYLPINRLAGDSPNILLILYSILVNFNKIHRYIQQNEIHIVHGNDLRINLTWSLPTKLSRASYVWHQRTLMSTSFLWNFIYLLGDYFVTISNYVHETLPKNICKSNKGLVLNPFNATTLYNRSESRHFIESLYSVPKEVILVGYIGRLVEWKNIDFLIKCFLEYDNHSIHLMVVGTGRNDYISKLKKISQNNNSITFSGFSNNPNRIIAGFDIMIAPSSTEPFGRTLIEAMIQKTPVIAAIGGGHMEIIKHRGTGWLYNHGNIEDFIFQLKEVINEYEITSSVVKKAHIYACSEYSSSKHVENIINIYRQLY